MQEGYTAQLPGAKAWLHLCGAKYKMESDKGPATWTRLVQAQADERCGRHREGPTATSPPTKLFGGEYEKIGRAELYKVLKAYSAQPSDGYCLRPRLPLRL